MANLRFYFVAGVIELMVVHLDEICGMLSWAWRLVLIFTCFNSLVRRLMGLRLTYPNITIMMKILLELCLGGNQG